MRDSPVSRLETCPVGGAWIGVFPSGIGWFLGHASRIRNQGVEWTITISKPREKPLFLGVGVGNADNAESLFRQHPLPAMDATLEKLKIYDRLARNIMAPSQAYRGFALSAHFRLGCLNRLPFCLPRRSLFRLRPPWPPNPVGRAGRRKCVRAVLSGTNLTSCSMWVPVMFLTALKTSWSSRLTSEIEVPFSPARAVRPTL